jgi:hypothetical protein
VVRGCPVSQSPRAWQADLRAAEKARQIRYAAATTALTPQPVTAVTAAQAAAELVGLRIVAERIAGQDGKGGNSA